MYTRNKHNAGAMLSNLTFFFCKNHIFLDFFSTLVILQVCEVHLYHLICVVIVGFYLMFHSHWLSSSGLLGFLMILRVL
uniref:Uncharacterized protein n=1 Tax=Nelumbo nucifera TaxID=4432 RepID=A0A822YSD5_NELNU|nr:TPA_asm: hypothetical protein HUJ06_012816 [Nelumbo nucifera]